ncbi:probable cold shock domain-containing protein E1 [Coccomyxa sp. Obi]|nr:probable cold shock domain-containing protein E1 [Coccomyxa sp. Obi]
MMDDQQRPPEPSTSDQRPHEGQTGRRHPKGHQQGRGGGRGRGNQGRQGPSGIPTPPGLGKARHGHRDANGTTRQQHEEACAHLPVGTKLRGFVDHVRENFGFIRLAEATDLIFFHISAVLSDKPAAADGAPESTASSEKISAAALAEGGVQTDAGQLGSAAQQVDEMQGPKQQGDKGKKRDLSELLQPGDAVEFVVAASSQEGVRQHKGSRPPKMMGKEVRKLPPGTLATSSVSEQLVRGRVERPLAGSSSTSWNREANGGGGGLIAYAHQDGGPGDGDSGKRQVIGFEGTDVKGRTGRLNKGDPVQFFITTDVRTGKRRATQVQREVQQAQPDPEAPREHGFVEKFMNTYGFVRSIEREGQPPLFFHISEVADSSVAEVASGAEVAFSVVPDAAGKYTAVALELLPSGTVAEERRWPGRMRGRVVKPPGVHNEQFAYTGRATFQDAGGTLRSCSFPADQVRGGEEAAHSLAPEDEVEFDVVTNRKTGGFRAEDVELLCKAEDRRELGQIKQLKEAKEPGGGGFGFIRACDRAADVFFHFSQLSDVAPADLAPGDDVEFSVVREPLPDAPKRIVAHRVTRAPKGSAVFEVVSEEQYSGVVLDRMQAKGSNIASGLVQYELDGVPSKLTYGPKDLQDPKVNPKPQDHVTFRIAVNPKAAKAAEKVGGAAAQHAGRRATQVALQQHTGRIFSFKGTFGFLEYDMDGPKQPPPRLYFNANDVEGNVQLRPGDEVTFTMANRNPRADGSEKERSASNQGAHIARRVIRTKEAAAKPEEELPAERPQQAPKFIKANTEKPLNAVKGGQAARIARGPDGTKGFAPGRGRPMPPAAPVPIAPGSVLRPSLSSNSLNPTAAEFVPRSFESKSSASLESKPSSADTASTAAAALVSAALANLAIITEPAAKTAAAPESKGIEERNSDVQPSEERAAEGATTAAEAGYKVAEAAPSSAPSETETASLL